MLVAMPTAMPDEPFTSSSGMRVGARRVPQCIVEVVDEFYRILADVRHHLVGYLAHAGLRITHGRGAVAVHRPKLP